MLENGHPKDPVLPEKAQMNGIAKDWDWRMEEAKW